MRCGGCPQGAAGDPAACSLFIVSTIKVRCSGVCGVHGLQWAGRAGQVGRCARYYYLRYSVLLVRCQLSVTYLSCQLSVCLVSKSLARTNRSHSLLDIPALRPYRSSQGLSTAEGIIHMQIRSSVTPNTMSWGWTSTTATMWPKGGAETCA